MLGRFPPPPPRRHEGGSSQESGVPRGEAGWEEAQGGGCLSCELGLVKRVNLTGNKEVKLEQTSKEGRVVELRRRGGPLRAGWKSR